MMVNEYGQVQFATQEVIDKFYAKEWESVDVLLDQTNELNKFNEHCKHFEIDSMATIERPTDDVLSFHAGLSSNWHMPKEYKEMDVLAHLTQQLQEKTNANTEYTDYFVNELDAWNKFMGSKGSQDLFKFLHHLITTCRANDIVTGVGRGSSVSSLILYLLGVHYVDPVKYKLNYEEFLR